MNTNKSQQPMKSYLFGCFSLCSREPDWYPTTDQATSTRSENHYQTLQMEPTSLVNVSIKKAKAKPRKLKDSSVSFQMNSLGTSFCISYNTSKSISCRDTETALCKYIARRCNSSSIIADLCAEQGKFTVQFQSESDFVFAIESETPALVRKAIMQYKCEERVEIIQTQHFEKLRNLQSDLVFINLTSKRVNLDKLIRLGFSKNIVVLVPYRYNIRKFVDVICSIKSLEYISYECETITLNDQARYKVIYFGEPSRLNHEDELCAISQSLLQEGAIYRSHDMTDAIYDILKVASLNVGLHRLVELVVTALNANNQQKTVMGSLLDEIQVECILNFHQLNEIISQKHHHHHSHRQLFKAKVSCCKKMEKNCCDNSNTKPNTSNSWTRQYGFVDSESSFLSMKRYVLDDYQDASGGNSNLPEKSQQTN